MSVLQFVKCKDKEIISDNSKDKKIVLSPKMLQSVRRHSAVVLTVTVNGMEEIHPVMLSPI